MPAKKKLISRKKRLLGKALVSFGGLNSTRYCLLGVTGVMFRISIERGVGQFREFESPRVHTILE